MANQRCALCLKNDRMECLCLLKSLIADYMRYYDWDISDSIKQLNEDLTILAIQHRDRVIDFRFKSRSIVHPFDLE
jgi:hypothetical protein